MKEKDDAESFMNFEKFGTVFVRDMKYGSAVATVVLQRSVKPFPSGKQCWFESGHSHKCPYSSTEE